MASARPRRALWLLVAATCMPLGLLVWLGLRTVRQDSQLDLAIREEALRLTAGQLALDIERDLQDVEQRLAGGDGIRFTDAGPLPGADDGLVYRRPPGFADLWLAPAMPEAEEAEFARNWSAAAAAYRQAARSSVPATRAAALLGLGRVLRLAGNRQAALEAYASLTAMDDVVVAGAPAALVGRFAAGRILEASGETAALEQLANEFGRALAAGGWAIDRPAYAEYTEAIRRWGGPVPPAGAEARAEAALQLWRRWRAGELGARGRQLLPTDAGPFLAVWTEGPSSPVGWLANGQDLEARWQRLADERGIRVAALLPDGTPVFDDIETSGETPVSLEPRDTRLPFILAAQTTGPPADEGRRWPRAALVGVLLLAGIVTCAATFGLYRATSREMALARQQRDFVSAVSHEFRTPLTSMRHLTDLLSTRAVTSDERRTHYYGLLARETDRLQRMVESLLSFGRIEAGAYAWQLQPVDLGAFATAVVEEFRTDGAAGGRMVSIDVDDGPHLATADTEALARALWNLLDNAAKYSEAGSPIAVSVRSTRGGVSICVEDHGVGIEHGDLDRIFQKFVRGANRAGRRGVGIGLALVTQIIEAHGGAVRVTSQAGQGSTFTLELPATGAPAEA